MAYDEGFRLRLAEACQRAMAMERPGFEPLIASVEAELTERHVQAVADLLGRSGHVAQDIGVIGFHGHTVAHRPERGWTWQIGDGAGLAGAFGIPVVADLRQADVVAGGQGAPLLPVYHRALADGLAKALHKYLTAKARFGLRPLLLGEANLEEVVELVDSPATSISTPRVGSGMGGAFKVKCPSCDHGVLAFEEGCSKCHSCGYSQC